MQYPLPIFTAVKPRRVISDKRTGFTEEIQSYHKKGIENLPPNQENESSQEPITKTYRDEVKMTFRESDEPSERDKLIQEIEEMVNQYDSSNEIRESFAFKKAKKWSFEKFANLPLQQLFFEDIAKNEAFQSLSTYRAQVAFILAEKNIKEANITNEHIGFFFNTSRQSIDKIKAKIMEDIKSPQPKICHRKMLINDTQMEQIKDKLKKWYEKFGAFSVDDAANVFSSVTEKYFLADTVRYYMRTYINDTFKPVTGIPQEENRVIDHSKEIDDFYDEMENLCKEIPAAFIFNLDEGGQQDYVDAKKQLVYVANDFIGDSIQIPFDRTQKRSTLIACISGDGGHLKPLLVVPRVTVDSEILHYGIVPERIIIRHQKHGFVDYETFKAYWKTIFAPSLIAKRLQFQYFGPSLLIMDGYGAHTISEVINPAKVLNLKIKIIPPHTSDQMQMCDLGIFSVQKSKMSHMKNKEGISKLSNQIIRIYNSYEQATVAPNVIQAFKRAGFVQEPRSINGKIITFLKVDRAEAKSVKHFIQMKIADPTAPSSSPKSERIKLDCPNCPFTVPESFYERSINNIVCFYENASSGEILPRPPVKRECKLCLCATVTIEPNEESVENEQLMHQKIKSWPYEKNKQNDNENECLTSTSIMQDVTPKKGFECSSFSSEQYDEETSMRRKLVDMVDYVKKNKAEEQMKIYETVVVPTTSYVNTDINEEERKAKIIENMNKITDLILEGKNP